MPENIDYLTGDVCGGFPEECEKEEVASGVDTCPELCCPENRNDELINKVTYKTRRKLIEKLNK